MEQRRPLEETQPRLRNVPMHQRDWRRLLESDEVTAVEGDGGALVLSLQDGQLTLHYAFTELEAMRRDFGPMFEELKPEIASFGADHLRIDLVQLPDRTWIEPLLSELDFRLFAEWMEMVHHDLHADYPPPQFPPEASMRRGGSGDFDRIVEIERDALGDLADGEAATLERLEDAAWVGVLEREGETVAYAINGPVEGAEGRILSFAVDPSGWGNGYGALVAGAATYQVTTNEARRALIRVRPDVPQALRTMRDLGFVPGISGVEWRRPTDEQVIAERRAEARFVGVKARFGDWR